MLTNILIFGTCALGLGCVLGGLVFALGYHIGYRYGLEAGYNEASRANEREDKLLNELKELADKD